MVSTRPNLSAGRASGPPEPVAPGSAGSGRRLLLGGLAAAVVLGVGAGVYFNAGMRDGRSDERPVSGREGEQGVRPAAADEGLTFSPPAAREPYRPVDVEAVRRAYAQVGAVYASEGVSGLARSGLQCFRSLEREPSYSAMDFCLAFDAIAAAVNQRLSGATPAPSTSWFGRTEERDRQVAQAVLGAEGDASARLLDIRRIAVEVAREGGPVVQASGAATSVAPAPAVVAEAPQPVEPPPPAPARAAAAPQPRPTRQATAPAASPRPAAAAREAPRQVATAPARPARATTSQAAARPSFNCRSARTASERMVCGDPGLAALDRGLNAAYEEAIAAGADRRTLRAAQDRWLGVRESAASDPDAVAAAYRRRIDELRAMR